MWVVKLSGDILKVYNEEQLSFMKSLGFFVTSVYADALQYASCILNRGKNSSECKYHDYFQSC